MLFETLKHSQIKSVKKGILRIYFVLSCQKNRKQRQSKVLCLENLFDLMLRNRLDHTKFSYHKDQEKGDEREGRKYQKKNSQILFSS